MVDEREVGRRIKARRLGRGITLQDLAKRTGFTRGYLSKVENSTKAPPVSTLIILAKALNVMITEFFAEPLDKSPICLVKKNDRRSITRDGSGFGYGYQTLAHRFHNKHMEPYILNLPMKPKRNALFQHKGEEMLFVLEGTMKFLYGDKDFTVEEGDCIYFDANVPHYGISQGDDEVKCLMVIYSE